MFPKKSIAGSMDPLKRCGRMGFRTHRRKLNVDRMGPILTSLHEEKEDDAIAGAGASYAYGSREMRNLRFPK